MNISLKLVLGIACSFSMLMAAEVPSSIEIVDEGSTPVVSSPVKAEAAPSKEVKKTETVMVSQTLPAQEPVLNKSEPKPAPVIVRLSPSQNEMRTIVIEKEGYAKTDVNALRSYYPIELTVGITASLGSAIFLTSDFDTPDFSGLFWSVGGVVVFPVNDATVGMSTGLTFKYRYASAVLDVPVASTRYRFKQMALDLPLLFKFKRTRSRLSFDAGIGMSVNFYDKLQISSEGARDESYDLIDASFRAPIDWNLLTGFSVMISQRASFNMKFLLGISEMYNTPKIKGIAADFSPLEMSMGVTVNLF
ncbi:MAG TPA: PorT family protein [Fibrobacter sp.]|nr:PorT family protein [Fibrobacter sp.]